MSYYHNIIYISFLGCAKYKEKKNYLMLLLSWNYLEIIPDSMSWSIEFLLESSYNTLFIAKVIIKINVKT